MNATPAPTRDRSFTRCSACGTLGLCVNFAGVPWCDKHLPAELTGTPR